MSDIIAPGTTAGANGFYALEGHNKREQDYCDRDRGWTAGDVRGFMASQFDAYNAAMRRADADTAAADRQAKFGSAETSRQHAAIFEAVTRYGASGELATEKTAAAINLAIEKTAAAGVLEATKNAAASALAAARDTASVLAAQAECCCELREAISAQGNQTRELMLKLDADSAARREAALAAQVSQLQLVAAMAARS